MKFKDKVTGLILETKNDFVIGQYKKHANRYQEVKPNTTKSEEKASKK